MARWGRKGLLQRIFGGAGPYFRPSFRRTKTVSWGSRSRPAVSGSGAGWGRRPPVAKWGSKTAGRQSRQSQQPSQPRTYRPLSKRKLLLWFFLVFMLLSVPSLVFIETNLRGPLMHVAKVRVKQVATQAINKAIMEQVARHSDTEKLIDWKMNDNGKVSGFMLNYAEHMSITSETIHTVQSTLTSIKDIPEHIPLGHALGSAIISSFGPKVPVRFEPVGAVKVELATRERNAAINMVLVEVYIRVIAEVAIIIPFDMEPELVETDIPISYLLVVGDVPMYYYDSTGKAVGETAPQAPNISVPLVPGAGISSQSDNSHGQREETGEGGQSILQMESR